MRVDFYGVYRPIVGSKSIELEIKRGATVRDALNSIVARFPSLRNELLDADSNLHPYMPLFVNGRNPRLLSHGVNTVLQPEDVLSIFSPIASGRLNVEDIKHATAV